MRRTTCIGTVRFGILWGTSFSNSSPSWRVGLPHYQLRSYNRGRARIIGAEDVEGELGLVRGRRNNTKSWVDVADGTWWFAHHDQKWTLHLDGPLDLETKESGSTVHMLLD